MSSITGGGLGLRDVLMREEVFLFDCKDHSQIVLRSAGFKVLSYFYPFFFIEALLDIYYNTQFWYHTDVFQILYCVTIPEIVNDNIQI